MIYAISSEVQTTDQQNLGIKSSFFKSMIVDCRLTPNINI